MIIKKTVWPVTSSQEFSSSTDHGHWTNMFLEFKGTYVVRSFRKVELSNFFSQVWKYFKMGLSIGMHIGYRDILGVKVGSVSLGQQQSNLSSHNNISKLKNTKQER